jgi:nitrous oxide reductase accessory protein NosL
MVLFDRQRVLSALLFLLALAGCAPTRAAPEQAPYQRDDNDMHGGGDGGGGSGGM